MCRRTKATLDCSRLSGLDHGCHGHLHHLISSAVQNGLNSERELWRNVNRENGYYVGTRRQARVCLKLTYRLLLCKNVPIKGLSALLLLPVTLPPNVSLALHLVFRQLRILHPLQHEYINVYTQGKAQL